MLQLNEIEFRYDGETPMEKKIQSVHFEMIPAITVKCLRATSTRSFLCTLLAVILFAGLAGAQTPIAASTQFDITGHIQVATLGGPGSGNGAGAHQGGFIKVNGHVITVPSETIVILPANALTWAEIFSLAPAPYGPSQTGLALADTPAPLTAYQARVVGNRVNGVYIAGLITIWQDALNTGQGFINFINYTTGEIRVGGTVNFDGAGNPVNVLDPNDPGARVQLNDPLNAAVGTGRFGRAVSADIRFTVDQDNPTVRSVTGFPMCIPRADPAVAPDALCPQTQRPAAAAPATGFASIIQMNNPALVGVPPDASIQAPFEVGDYVTFAGTLVHDGANPTAGPWPGDAATYISAHTITNNVSIYTWPGTNPAYVAVDVSLIGVGGLIVVGAGEAAVRTRFEGFSTDPSRVVHLYGIDLAPGTGATSDRTWGTIGIDPGPIVGAAKGRWRFRPPCILTAPNPVNFKDCQGPPSGSFLPPTREVRAVVEGSWVPGQVTTFANGIIAGQYHAPIADYLFPENVPGAPIVENTFNSMPFLAQGGYSSSQGTVVGQLNPWPSDVVPAQFCAPAVASAGGPYAVVSGGTVALAGSATGTAPITFAWSAPTGSFSDPTLPNPNYTAPLVAVDTPVTLTLAATNCGGTSTSTATVTVSTGLAPIVSPIANQTVTSGSPGSFAVTGSDPNTPPATPLTWAISQTGAPALIGLTITSTGATTANVTYTAPAGVTAPTSITVTVTATNTASLTSAPVSLTVTILPAAVPVVNPVAPISLFAGAASTVITLSGSDPNVPSLLPLTFSVSQSGAPALVGLLVTQGPNPPGTTATLTFVAPSLPAGQITPSVVTLTIRATDTGGLVSAPVTTTVTINPLPDLITVASAEYRVNQKRLVITVNDANPNVTLRLQPYVTTTGTTYNPDPAAGGVGNVFTNNLNGTYTISVAAVPAPACNANGNFATPCGLKPLDVKSNIQNVPGDSGFFALTRIR
jgi:hypothetical protein